jgi:uncharacterized protein YegP (UPF0339 family)
MAGWFQLQRSGSQFQFTFMLRDGQPALSSGAYMAKHIAESVLATLRIGARVDGRYERRKSGDGGLYFVFKSRGGEILCTSQTYRSPEARERDIELVKDLAPSAPASDDTSR